MALLVTQPLLSALPRRKPFSSIPPPLLLPHPQPGLSPYKPCPTTPFSIHHSMPIACRASRRKSTALSSTSEGSHLDDRLRRILQLALWTAEAVFILWLFLLPYAPGDPVWAICSDTINSLIGLSLNFFFVLPLTNAVGIRLIDAPVLHPMSEGLFKFVIGWTLMFAPLLYSDCKRDRYKSSLDVLWGLQMFLTNSIILNSLHCDPAELSRCRCRLGELSPLGSAMTNGTALVEIISGAVCLLSVIWGVYGRMDGDFGNTTDRWQYLVSYLGSERLAYAFIWDICLYTIFQPWLIGENL